MRVTNYIFKPKTNDEKVKISKSPLEKTLIETDSPYLAPVPNRGKKNEPSFVKYTAKKLADIKEISLSDLIKNTTSNFNRLFS